MILVFLPNKKSEKDLLDLVLNNGCFLRSATVETFWRLMHAWITKDMMALLLIVYTYGGILLPLCIAAKSFSDILSPNTSSIANAPID